MSGGSVAAMIGFVTIGLLSCFAGFMVNWHVGPFGLRVNLHLFIGELDPWSFRTSIKPKSTRPSIVFTPFRAKKT